MSGETVARWSDVPFSVKIRWGPGAVNVTSSQPLKAMFTVKFEVIKLINPAVRTWGDA